MAMQPTVVDASVAFDTRALDSLRQQARGDPKAALAKAAGQFEALFMQMLLKSMREALPQDGPLASETTKQYTAMFDQQIAQHLAKRGIGVADMLVKQLSRNAPVAGAPAPAEAPATREPASTSLRRTSGPLPVRPVAAPVLAPVPQRSPVPTTVQGFVDTLRPYAEAVARAARIPAELLLGQAGLESGWGRHQPQAADGTPSHNLFGVKAGAGWTGPVVEAATTEFVDGRRVTKVERFRAYGSFTEAFTDFAKLIGRNPRYAPALANTGDAAAYARSMQQAGYATDPLYAAKLTRAIETATRQSQTVRAPTWAKVPALPADNRPKSA